MSTDAGLEDVTELAGDDREPTRIADTRRTIGRYQLLYELGTGGMANVYLARAQGPGDFFKWFAIKRIHPHLARSPQFIQMFLDEARIAAAVHHPNVAHVFDLGEEDDEYFIAMEYLHGEHLGSLMARAHKTQGHLRHELAARILSWAADGLHHAHELRDAHGRPLGIVHRDVSPQNIFVTYDGAVKLTDFGIAKAENRITQTKTGQMKGKTAYMSPEQALGKELDRRSDVFALGTVLWEATTGLRLFKAETDAQTLMRITTGRVVRPTQVVPGYPPDLERIVLRALAMEPGDRYPSAAAMARDLERYLAATGAPVGASEITAEMNRLFGDRIATKEAILRSGPDTVPDLVVPTPTGISDDGGPPAEISRSQVRVPARTEVPRTPSRRPALVVGGVALLVLALGAIGLFWAMGRSGAVRIDSRPSGASVTVDGVDVGRTPVLLRDVEEGRHLVALSLSGHEPFETTFDSEGSRVELVYHLMPGTLEEPAPHGPDEGVAATEEEPPAEAPVAETLPEPEPDNVAEAELEGSPATDEAAPALPPATQSARDPAAKGPRERARPAGRAKLNLLSEPWATVEVGGRSLGQTPLFGASIPSGRVVVKLRALGKGPVHTLVVRARPGETVARRVDLH